MIMTTGESLFEQYRLECGMDNDDVRACTWHKAGLIDFADWLLQQKLEQCSVSGWLEFEKQMPDTDKLILVTNGQFVEICYYENERLYKPWRFDEDDRCAFRIRNVNDPSWVQLWWRVIELPTIH